MLLRFCDRVYSVQLLAKLLDLTFWGLSVVTDGEAVKYIHKQGKERYFMDLVRMEMQSAQEDTQLCVDCTMARGALNKPKDIVC